MNQDKCIIRIPQRGLFLTCRESAFLSSTHNTKYNNIAGAFYLQEKCIPLLGKAFPCSWWRSPILPGPCLKSTAFMPLALPSPPHPLPANRTFIYIQTDNINTPATSVRRNPGRPVVPVSSWFSCTGSSVLAVLSWLLRLCRNILM
jgi:hypothetical protein